MTHDMTPLAAPPSVQPPLIIAAHGTRDAAGAAQASALVDLVAAALPEVDVRAGFVELTPPTITEAIDGALASADAAVVVPLMLGRGGHVREDIPDAIDEARDHGSGVTVVTTRHLGAAPQLVDAALARIDAARGAWSPAETVVVFVGRGCSVTDANADHARLARVVAERGGYAHVIPAFVQVTSPSVPEALAMAAALGASKAVVMPHYLFTGRLDRWVHDQSEAFATAHPDMDVRVAEVIGPCPELASVVVQRYREGARQIRTTTTEPAYLSGLLLRGRRVVAVGGGCVNRRRVPKLVDSGADVTLVAPVIHPALQHLVDEGRLTWKASGYEASDLDDAWYVLASTDDPATNARIAADAEARHTFCVRADKAGEGSAWTPATGRLDGATVAVLADHDPRRSKSIRDRIITTMEGA